jgi:two-component sensor histidine kinase
MILKTFLSKRGDSEAVWKKLVEMFFHFRRGHVWLDVVVVSSAFLVVHVAFAVSIYVSSRFLLPAGWVSFTVLFPLILTPVKFGIVPGALAGIVILLTIPLLQRSMGFSGNLPAHLSQMLALLTLAIPVATGLVAGTIRALRRDLSHERMIKREAHHRIKNSLSLVFSLLNLAQDEVRNENETDVLRRAAGHVAGIAAVHDSLSRSSSFELIDLGEHLERLGRQFEDAGHSSRVLKVEGARVCVSGSIAVAVGLVLNELIMNARKHGVAGGDSTKVVFLTDGSPGKLKLDIEQPFVQLPEDFSLDTASGMGIEIIRGVLDQYGGRIAIVERDPARFTVTVDRGVS